MSLSILQLFAAPTTTTDPYAFRVPTGTDKFLDPNAGADGTGSEASPWNVLSQTKLQSLSAGQALWIKNGTVTAVEARGLASGTASNRITVAAYPGHTATLAFPTDGILMGGGDYWDWRGLKVTCEDYGWYLPGSNPGSGAAVPINYWRFIDINATKGTLGTTDNSGIIYMGASGVDYISVIRGTYAGPGGEPSNNRSGIWIDGVKHVEVIGALIYGHNIPVYYKHNHQQASNQVTILFKNCIFKDQSRSMLQCVAYATYQNCAFNGTDLSFSDDGGNPAGDYNTIQHCTFYDCGVYMNPPQDPVTTDLIPGAYGNTLRNNVIAGTNGIVWDNRYGALSSLDQATDTDYNAYTSGSSIIGRNGSFYSLSGYKTAFTGRETHSVSGTISLVGSTTPGVTPANFALQVGSTGKGAGNDGADMGVDATKLLTVN